MRIDLFAVPIHVGKVNLNQIQLTSDMGKKWVSKTPTSFERKNFLDKESEKYLIDCIGNLIKDHYYSKFQLGILDTITNGSIITLFLSLVQIHLTHLIFLWH